MYKIIMIDDEDIVLNTIPYAIDWNSYGLELVATFNDAETALNYIDSHPVDGIFTDIQMPGMSGLELAQDVHLNHPNTVIFIISAYSNFDYAREAMSYDVAGYLLKPLDLKNLSDACRKMYEKIDSIYNSNTIYYFTTSQCPNKLQKLISDYVNKKQHHLLAEISQSLEEYQYDADIVKFPCGIISVTIVDLLEYLSDTWTHGKENLFVALNQLMVCDNLYIFPLYQSFDKIELLILSKTLSLQEFQTNINKFKNTYTTNCFETLNIIILIDTLAIYKSLSTLSTSLNSNNYGFQKILNYIIAGSEDLAVATFNDMLDLCTYDILPDLNNFLASELINQIGLKNLNRTNIYPEPKLTFNPNYSYNETLSIINKASLYFKNIKTNTTSIHTAKQYIDEHYSENISLAFLSELTYMSISQFTRTFKKEFNISFLNYLNKVRIKQACRLLLSTQTPPNNICGMVGYTSYSYFSKKFKQHTGQTIAEYRRTYK